MTAPADTNQALAQLARSFVVGDQLKLRNLVRGQEGYYRRIVETYLNNPFLRLTDDELKFVSSRVGPPHLARLILAREAAVASKAPRYAVFCMPKSGSSFIQSALRHALQLPFVSLTSFGGPGPSSHFGMNSREQEIDELALIKAVVMSPQGFVAQHHTRYSVYLGLQMTHYGVAPIVTVRNIPDAIVSFDDMMLDWRRQRRDHRWVSDAQFALPEDYQERDEDVRYTLLAHTFGTWLLNFYLSWKRSRVQNSLSPLIVRYEDHVLDRERLVDVLSSHIGMSEPQTARLRAYAEKPDRHRSRLNVGRRGRGEKLPQRIRDFLSDYAGLFRSELTDDELAYLVG